MTDTLIAIASKDNGKISPHAGRAKHWTVYAVSDQKTEKVWDMNLSREGSLHEWHVRGDGNRHPLHSVDIAICGSAGEGVTRRLAERQTQLITTTETDPLAAIEGYLANTLAPGLPHEEAECLDPAHREEVH